MKLTADQKAQKRAEIADRRAAYAERGEYVTRIKKDDKANLVLRLEQRTANLKAVDLDPQRDICILALEALTKRFTNDQLKAKGQGQTALLNGLYNAVAKELNLDPRRDVEYGEFQDDFTADMKQTNSYVQLTDAELPIANQVIATRLA